MLFKFLKNILVAPVNASHLIVCCFLKAQGCIAFSGNIFRGKKFVFFPLTFEGRTDCSSLTLSPASYKCLSWTKDCILVWTFRFEILMIRMTPVHTHCMCGCLRTALWSGLSPSTVVRGPGTELRPPGLQRKCRHPPSHATNPSSCLWHCALVLNCDST